MEIQFDQRLKVKSGLMFNSEYKKVMCLFVVYMKWLQL